MRMARRADVPSNNGAPARGVQWTGFDVAGAAVAAVVALLFNRAS
ncbi:hypothetical protein RCH14_003418 [Massilia sp. MP_M2]